MNGNSSTAIRVLHVDDDPEFLELTKAALGRLFDEITVETVLSAEEGLEILEADAIDCVVTDYHMPTMDGLEFLTHARADEPSTVTPLPIIFFTGKGSEDIAVEAIAAGVTDYLQKGVSHQFQLLGSRIVALVERRRSEEHVRAADRRVREIYERIADGVVVFDPQWHITFVNENAATMLDTPEDELVHSVFWDRFPEMAYTPLGELLNESMDSARSLVFEEYAPSLERWVRAVTYPDDEGMVVLLSDLEQQKRTEEELARLRDELDVTQAQFRTLRQKMEKPKPAFR